MPFSLDKLLQRSMFNRIPLAVASGDSLFLRLLKALKWYSVFFDAGWSSPVARQAHNLKVVGSNPTPATTLQALWNKGLRIGEEN